VRSIPPKKLADQRPLHVPEVLQEKEGFDMNLQLTQNDKKFLAEMHIKRDPQHPLVAESKAILAEREKYHALLAKYNRRDLEAKVVIWALWLVAAYIVGPQLGFWIGKQAFILISSIKELF
jgi:hypothetical protein